MARSSEEVLLIVNNVRNKKSDGVLYMMGTRMAWMQESKNSFSISHGYADIKGKAKAILKKTSVSGVAAGWFKKMCEWGPFFSFLQTKPFFLQKLDNIFLPKFCFKNAATLLASITDTLWTGSRSFFGVAQHMY